MQIRVLFPPSLGQSRAEARGQGFAEVLAIGLDDEVLVDVAASYDALEQAIASNSVDLAWAPPIVCARCEPTVRAILTAQRGGRSTYCAAWIGRTDDKLTRGDLSGKRAVWVDPLSTGGYLLAVADLRAQDIDPGALFAQQQFAGSYVAALRAVVDGNADVCSIYAPTANDAQANSAIADLIYEDGVKLAPFAYTMAVPGDGLIITSRLPDDHAENMLSRLRRATDGRAGRTALLTLLDAERLVQALPDAYAPLRSALKISIR